MYYDLLTGREERKADNVAIVRMEQMYPFPQTSFAPCSGDIQPSEVYWVQEEPRNMGPWRFDARIHSAHAGSETRRTLHYAGRTKAPARQQEHKTSRPGAVGPGERCVCSAARHSQAKTGESRGKANGEEIVLKLRPNS